MYICHRFFALFSLICIYSLQKENALLLLFKWMKKAMQRYDIFNK